MYRTKKQKRCRYGRLACRMMRKYVKPGMSPKDLRQLLEKCLDEVPLDFIRRAARKSERYMDAYRKGATGRLAEFANKKYSSHRCLPDSWFDELKAEYEAKYCEEAGESILPEGVDGSMELAALGEFGQGEG